MKLDLTFINKMKVSFKLNKQILYAIEQTDHFYIEKGGTVHCANILYV